MLANLNQNFTQYSSKNADFTDLKIICHFVKYSLLAAMLRKTLVKVPLQQWNVPLKINIKINAHK